MLESPIADDEVLYRRIPDNKGLLKRLPDGAFKISSQAFYEPSHRPSVDRAKLCENSPKKTSNRYPGPCGIASIVAHGVRAINLVHPERDPQPPQAFIVDVEPKPIIDDPGEPDNPAHAEIYTEPMCSRKVFHK